MHKCRKDHPVSYNGIRSQLFAELIRCASLVEVILRILESAVRVMTFSRRILFFFSFIQNNLKFPARESQHKVICCDFRF